MNQKTIDRWHGNSVAFVRECLRDPETGEQFVLYPEEETFLREALTLHGSRLLYPELVFSAPKKSGKTMLAAMATLYVIVVLGGKYAEGYCLANDYEQSSSRVFAAIVKLIQACELKHDAKITESRIEFPSTGSFIQALANDYAGAAGSNPTISVFDENWAYVHERSRRLFDEMVPSPARKVSVRLSVTYAGFSGESELLESLYNRGLQGEQIAPDLYRGNGMLMYWTHKCHAPWQTPEWIEQMRAQLRPNAFLRLIENRWVTSESNFIDIAWWDDCVDPDLSPVLADRELSVWIGVDASVKRDSTAVVGVTFDHELRKVRLVRHRIFQPTATDPLDFEATIEQTLLDWKQRYRLREVRYDPYQMQAVAQRLTASGVPMVEFPQSVSNLTESSTNLYELIKGRNLITYADDDMRLAVSRAVALETSRGWRIAKDKVSHKIDVVVALAQAVLGAVQSGQIVGAGFDHKFQGEAQNVLSNLDKYAGTPFADSSKPRAIGLRPHNGNPRYCIPCRDAVEDGEGTSFLVPRGKRTFDGW
jgi:hypothetical protein